MAFWSKVPRHKVNRIEMDSFDCEYIYIDEFRNLSL